MIGSLPDWAKQPLLVLSGDFNTDTAGIYTELQALIPALKPSLEDSTYPTFNSVQLRNRGHSPDLRAVQVTIDAVFYSAHDSVKVCGALRPSEWLSELMNEGKLREMEGRCEQAKKEGPEAVAKLVAEIRAGGDLGFPSRHWISDHIPVGTLFDIKPAKEI